jgi:phage terminase large subunit-like protein
MAAYDRIAKPRLRVPKKSLVVAGVDGARFHDALAIVAMDVERRHQWPVGIWERPKDAPDDYEHPFHQINGAMVELFEDFHVWRVYIDPQHIDYLVETWQGRWGEKRVVKWEMNRPRQVAAAVRNYTEAIAAGDFSHDDDPKLKQHHRQAVKQLLRVYDDHHKQMHSIQKDRHDSPRKIDGAAASVLAFEACGDAIAADAQAPKPAKLVTFS